jgi:hypothetical protein
MPNEKEKEEESQGSDRGSLNQQVLSLFVLNVRGFVICLACCYLFCMSYCSSWLS